VELSPFGRSRLPVTRLGLGLAALGRPGYLNLGHAGDLRHEYDVAVMEHRCHEVLDRAFFAGVRYVDVARSYGRGEEFLASWLAARQLHPGAITIGSKWGYTYTAGWQAYAEKHEVKDHSLATLERQLAESRAILGASFSLYHIHSATLESGVLDDTRVLDALARLRAGGLAVGLSVSGPRQAEVIRRALAVERDGVALFDSVQATWNLLERSAGDALAEAHAEGVGVIVKEGLANGRLTVRGHDDKAALLRDEAARLQVPPDALALAAALAQPWANVVLSGAATVAQLDDNLASLRVPYDAERLAALRETPETYWTTRSSLGWS